MISRWFAVVNLPLNTLRRIWKIWKRDRKKIEDIGVGADVKSSPPVPASPSSRPIILSIMVTIWQRHCVMQPRRTQRQTKEWKMGLLHLVWCFIRCRIASWQVTMKSRKWNCNLVKMSVMNLALIISRNKLVDGRSKNIWKRFHYLPTRRVVPSRAICANGWP